MNARQEAKLTMYRAVEQHGDDNPTIIAAVPAFQTAFTTFKTKINEITSATQFSDVPLAGIAVEKTNFKQTLAQTAADIAGLIFAYASATKNAPLKQEVKYNVSQLLTTRDDQLAPRCQNIHDKGISNLDALKDYGITQAKLDALQTAIDQYQASTPKPRTAVSQRKTFNTNLRRLFKEGDELLKDQMDKLVANFKETNPDFVTEYESNRIIIDPATTTTQLKGKVTQKSDGQPIKGAIITVVEPNLTATTNAAGEYLIKPIPNGKYTIRTTATGFQDFEAAEVVVKLGEINVFNAKL